MMLPDYFNHLHHQAMEVLKSRKRFLFVVFMIMLRFIFPAISVHSQSIINYKQASITFLRNGKFIEAMEYLNMAISREPYLSELYFLRGYAKHSLDDFIGAERDYSKSIDLSPFQPDVWINRAIVRSQQSNFTGAISDFAKALEMDSTNAEIYFNLAKIKLFLKKYYACLSDCNTAIRLEFPDENIYLLKGSAEVGIDRFDQAMKDFHQAIQINPENPNCYIQLGSVWLEKEEADSAIRYFNHALKLDSNNIYTLFNRSLAYSKLPDQDNALEDLNLVIRLSPYNSYAYFNRAIVLNEMNDTKGAIRDFSAVIKLNPRNITSFFYRSQLKARMDDLPGALEDLNKTIELFPGYADAYYQRYLIKTRMKDHPGASQDYQLALEMSEKYHLTIDSLASGKDDYLQSLVKLSGDFEEMNTMNSKFQNQYVDIQLLPIFNTYLGKKTFDHILFYDTYQKKHYFTNIISFTHRTELLSDSLFRQEIQHQNSLLDSLPLQASAYFKRAVSYAGLQKYNQAFSDYDSTLLLDPDFVLAWFNRANSRYELIRLIESVEHGQNLVVFGNPLTGEDSATTGEMEHTLARVIADYDQALILDPEFFIGYYNRGVVHCTMGNYQNAIEDFSRALEFRPDFAEASFNIGLIYLLLNDLLHGCEHLSHAGELGILDAYKVMKRYCYK